MKPAALRRTVDKIEKQVENPLCIFDMADWTHKVMKDGSEYDRYSHYEKPCGTAACFAGWAVSEKVRKAYTYGDVNIEDAAADKLGLDEDQASLLFDTGGWPDKFGNAYYRASYAAEKHNLGTKKRLAAEKRKVNILRARVEHFIATGGRE